MGRRGALPNPNARRGHSRTNGEIALPSGGRTGRVPAWPLAGKAPASWAAHWKLPQAVAWEHLSMHRLVARFVQVLERAEDPQATGVVLQEARHLETELGLTPAAMERLRWRIEESGAEVTPITAAKKSFDERMEKVKRQVAADEVRRRSGGDKSYQIRER